MGDRAEALQSFQSITGQDEATARCFLDSANWKVENALDTFFATGGDVSSLRKSTKSAAPEPKKSTDTTPPVTHGENDYQKLVADYKMLQEKLAFYEGSGSVPPTSAPKDAQLESRLKNGFAIFDPQGTGRIPSARIIDLLFVAGMPATQEEVERAKAKHLNVDMDDTVSFADIYSWLERVKNKAIKKDKGIDGAISFLGALKKKLIDPSLAKAQEKREGRDDSSTTSTTSSSDSRISVDIGAQVGPFDEARSGIEVEFQQDATLCGLLREELKAPEHAAVISIGFTVKEDTDNFGLGELSGTIKDILSMLKEEVNALRFLVQVKRATAEQEMLFRVNLFIESRELDEVLRYLEAINLSKLHVNLELSESPDDKHEKGEDEELIKARLNFHSELPRDSVDLLGGIVPSFAGGMKSKMMTRMKNLKLEVAFDTVSDLWDEYLEEAIPKDDSGGSDIPKIKNWESLKNFCSPFLGELFGATPPPVSVTYYDALDKLKGLGIVHFMLDDHLMTVRFKNVSLGFLPDKSEMVSVMQAEEKEKKKRYAQAQAYHGQLKIVLVGNSGVGKTCFAGAVERHKFPEEAPTVWDSVNINLTWRNLPLQLSVWDTRSSEDYSRLRPLNYYQTEIAFLCFAVNDKNSLESVQSWANEIKPLAPECQLVLLGLKSDLRDSPDVDAATLISVEDAQRAARAVGAMRYLECSALTHTGIAAVFPEALVGREEALVQSIGG